VRFLKGVGVDLKKYTLNSSTVKTELRNKYNYSVSDFILIYPAEFSRRKNQLFLLEVILKIHMEIPSIRLILPGNGDLLQELKDKAVSWDIEDHINFVGYRNDLDNLIQLSDVAVSSSKQEGLPVNVMMGMACGLPCVVTDCRGNNDLVHDDVNGWTISLNDVNLFCDKIRVLYNSEFKRISFGENSLKIIEEYSVENIIDSMKDIYTEVIE